MVVVGVPIGKLFYLLIKQASRPISRRVVRLAKQSDVFKRFVCMPPANAYNWVVTNVRIRMMSSEGKVKVLPLTEDKAIELGAELIGEVIIFAISTGIIVAEYSKLLSKAQAREDAQNDEIKKLRFELDTVKSHSDSQKQELALIREQLDSIEEEKKR